MSKGCEWILVLLIFSGCSNRDYHLFLTGFEIIPENIVVNEPAVICVFYHEYGTPDINKEFHWQIEGFGDDFVTEGGILRDLIFTTPRIKNIRVSLKSENKDFFSNEMHFVVNVKASE